ncbi:hypothetical protein GCM10009844_17360 [Nocardioides koreensis]|uniref:Uncharacterized protein n=1 Tax=Nocardioides koreensis TaxID=433651 RepID=A0ABN2ZLL9_9ACTN
MTQELAEEVFALAGTAIDVPDAPVEEVVARARSQRRRRRRAAAAAVAGLLVVVGLGTWVGTRPGSQPPPGPDQPPVVRVENPAAVAWWANDVLHLRHAAVEMPRVEDLVQLGDGAVIGDEDGDVVLVDGAGRLTTIGNKVAGAPLAASEHQGWVAWVDPGDRAPRLVVYDLEAAEVLATRDLPYRGPRWGSLDEGSHPIAVDGNQVYYAGQDGDWGWGPDGTGLVDVDGLLDVSAATIVKAAGADRIRIVQPFFSVDYVRTGVGAQLSPGGEHVLTRAPGGGGRFGKVLIYDTRSGERIWTGVRPQDVVVAATLGSDGSVSYVVAHGPDQPQGTDFVRLSFTGPYELRTCHLGERTCSRATKFPHTGALPILAR